MLKTSLLALDVVTMAAPALAELSGEQQVLNTINNVGYFADQGGRDQFAAQFHPEGAVLDYTSYANASAGTSDDLPILLPAEIVGACQPVLTG